MIENRKPKNPPFFIKPRRLKAAKIKTGEKAYAEQMKTVITKLKNTKMKR